MSPKKKLENVSKKIETLNLSPKKNINLSPKKIIIIIIITKKKKSKFVGTIENQK